MDREERRKMLANDKEVQDLFNSGITKDCVCGQKLKKRKQVTDEKHKDPKVKNGHTFGTLAAKSGCFSCVRHLMEQGNDPNLSYNDNESTMLHYASLNGRPHIVKLLVHAKADVNRANKRSRTALHEAATTGHPEVVRILLDHNADVMSKNKYGRTTLHVATKYNNLEVIELLVQDRKAKIVQSVSAAMEKHLHCYQLVKNLIYLVVDFTCGVADQENVCFCAQDLEDNDTREDQTIIGNEHGHTVATKAAVSGCVKCCTWLIRCGLNIDHPATDDGSSMLYCAVYKLRTACVQLLCKHNANVNKQNARGRLPIRTAVKTGNVEIVTALCEHGADLTYIRPATIHPRLVDIVNFYIVTNVMISDIRHWIVLNEATLLDRRSFDLVSADVRVKSRQLINDILNLNPVSNTADIPRVWSKVDEMIGQLRRQYLKHQKQLVVKLQMSQKQLNEEANHESTK